MFKAIGQGQYFDRSKNICSNKWVYVLAQSLMNFDLFSCLETGKVCSQ